MSTSDWQAIASSVIGAIAVFLLGMIFRAIAGLRNDVKRFMGEHLYLLRVADWAKVNLSSLFDHLHLSPTEPPPVLPDRRD